MQAIKQNTDKTTQCKSTFKEGTKRGRKSKVKPHDARRHAKGKENGYDKPGKTTRCKRMQRGRKIDVENHRKAGDAWRKTKTGVWQHARVSKHVSEAIKHGKRQAKSNQHFKTKFNQL